ncbi:hypothetical protein ES332_D01G155900v1 [Gossypium tomentosum]|uniref:Uncharacterized protein n=1 Tax=Gossypium tomentosum TaxID=34277 RepID=A0A5D2M9G7_GOSTO|nr:hypothetical protein ES332_D01G155900v1 [Gossypium tomentosum]
MKGDFLSMKQLSEMKSTAGCNNYRDCFISICICNVYVLTQT